MGWFSRARTDEVTTSTDAAWAGVLASLLGSALQDWRNPQPVDKRLLREVLLHVLRGEGSLVSLQRAIQAYAATGHWWATITLDDAGREAMADVCDAISGAEVERWERFVRVLQVLDNGRVGAGAAGTERWLPLLAVVVTSAHGVRDPKVTVGFLVGLAQRFGDSADDVVRHALRPGPTSWQTNIVGVALARMSDWGGALVAHRDLVAPRLATGSVDDRVHALGLLTSLDARQLAFFADGLAASATASSAKVRERAQPHLRRAEREPVVASLRAVATDGKPDARLYALTLLWQLGEDRLEVRAEARELAAADRAASVQALLAQWDASEVAPEDDVWDLPPEPTVVWSTDGVTARRLAEVLVRGVIRHVEQANVQTNLSVERHARHNPGSPRRSVALRDLPDPREVDVVAQALTEDTPPQVGDDVLHDYRRLPAVLVTVASDPDATPALLLRCVGEVRRLKVHDGTVDLSDALEQMHAQTGRPTLRELQLLLDASGLDGGRLVWRRYEDAWRGFARSWPEEHVWPFVAANLDIVLADSSASWGTDADARYRALATLPTTPARVVEKLYDDALGPIKAERGRARTALAKRPDRAARAAAALTSGKADTRLAAAQWLTDLGDPSAVPALMAAWRKERQDVVRGALLDALEAAGEDPGQVLSRERLLADAESTLAKGLPKDLDWLAWDTLPEVRWADGGSVPRTLLQGLAVQAVKAKSPEPNAIVRRACGMFDRADSEVFAERLLAAWLTEDLRPAPGGPPDQPGGSATSTKGLLAIVGACGGQRVVAPSERYLREWYGHRSSQGKALLAMLSWVDHRSATQLVLSVGSRFRTKAFQEEAVRLAESLAERKGWTLDELADRTIPTAGFEGDGVLSLPYGDRVFTARLRPDLSVLLTDPDGKVVKSLPQPRQSDDADAAQESKKTLAAAKKELKGIDRLQHDRLYEALCTGRSWLAADWLEHLAAHPVVRHQVQRLVWVGRPDDGSDSDDLATFRLLEDGTLTDVDDEPVELDPTWRVSLAHQTTLAPEAAEGWPEHLADYEVSPLFQQFGKAVYELPVALVHLSALEEFEGHLLEAFQLRGRALKLGWSRGPVEDAGWFHCYEKRFPTLGLTARLGFSGNGVPEENRTVALTKLEFVRHQPGGASWSSIMLGEVPSVLLSECRHDLASIAALGTGHDPDWEKTTQW